MTISSDLALFGITGLKEGDPAKKVPCPMPQHPEQTGKSPPVSVQVKAGKVLAWCPVCEVSLIEMLPHLNGTPNGTGPVEAAVEAIKVSGKGGLSDYAAYLGIEREFLKDLGLTGTKDTVVFHFGDLDATKIRHLDKNAPQKYTWDATVNPPLWPLPGDTVADVVDLTEGESDAITLRFCGFDAYATTKGGGAAISVPLLLDLKRRGMQVARVWPDADDTGKKLPASVRASAEDIDLEVRVADLSQVISIIAGEKDVNHVFKRLGAEEITRISMQARVYEARGPYTVTTNEVLSWGEEEVEWIIPDLLARGDKAILAAPQKSLKTYLTHALVVSCAAQGPFLDTQLWRPTRPINVLVIEEEGIRGMYGRRFRRVLNGFEESLCGNIEHKFLHRFNLLDPYQVDRVIEYAKENDFHLIVLDPLQRVIPGVDENSNKEMKRPWDEIHRITKEADVALLVNAHNRKNDAGSFEAIRGASRQGGEVELGMFLEKHEDVVRDELADTYTGTLSLTIEGRETPGSNDPLELKYVFDHASDSFTVKATGYMVAPKIERRANAKNQRVEEVFNLVAETPCKTREIVDRTGWSERTVKDYLHTLESDGRITSEDSPLGKAKVWRVTGVQV